MLVWHLILLLGISAVMLLVMVYSILYQITPMPTSFKARLQVFAALPPNPTGTVIELGCGWGSLIFPLAKHLPNCNVVGYEISPIPWLFCKIRHFFYPYPNLKIIRKDFLKTSFRDTSIFVCYLFPEAMLKIKHKGQEEFKAGAIVISNTFAIPGWVPEAVFEVNDIYKTKVYRYLTP